MIKPVKKGQNYKSIPFFNRVVFANQTESLVHSMINLFNALQGQIGNKHERKAFPQTHFLLELVLLQSSSARFH